MFNTVPFLSHCVFNSVNPFRTASIGFPKLGGLGSTANPSTQDIDVTQGLMRACEIMGIHMFDHIIVAGNDYYSFREKHAELYVKREENKKKDGGREVC